MKTDRIDSLQSLRFFAFLSIFAFHIGDDVHGMWKIKGYGGVSLFLILSGFLMAYNYWQKETQVAQLSSMSIKESMVFSAKKIKKLYPLHLLCLVPAIILQIYNYVFVRGLQIGEWALDLLKKVAVSVTLTQAWFPNGELCSALSEVAFYLSICAFLYFCFPFFTRFLYKSEVNSKKCISSIFLVLVIQSIISISVYCFRPGLTHWVTYFCPIFRFGDFAIGCFVGTLFCKKTGLECKKTTPLLQKSW